MKDLKVGQCIRIRKNVIPAFKAARAMAHADNASLRKSLDIPDHDPNAPSYTYLQIKHVRSEKSTMSADAQTGHRAIFIETIDLETFACRTFRSWGADLLKEEPGQDRRIRDFWGYDEIVRLTKADVRELLKESERSLKAEIRQARIYQKQIKRVIASL